MSLADARALLPTLTVEPADPLADHRALSALADWCGRYTPWTAVDRETGYQGEFGGGAGLWLDASGCAHLFGGEKVMLEDLVGRLENLGFSSASAAVAETAGAAWAIARFAGQKITVLSGGVVATALAPLPVRGLRLPADIAAALRRMGLRRIGDLLTLPRAPLAVRFGEALLRQLDQAMGRLDEPLSPRRPTPAFQARLAFAEPIGRRDDVAAALDHLLVDMCARLQTAHNGARRLELAAYRTDGTVARAAVGTSRPTRTPGHLRRLFGEKLDSLDPGFGIEVMTLGALVVNPLPPAQARIGLDTEAARAESLAQLVDRLGNRLGGNAVVHLAPHPTHIPERACRGIPAMMGFAASPLTPTLSRWERGAAARAGKGKTADIEDHRSRQPRPVNLLASPEPIEVVAPGAGRPAGAVSLAPHPLSDRPRRGSGADRPGVVACGWRSRRGGAVPHPRLLSGRGQRRPALLDLPRGMLPPDRPPRWYLHGMFG